MNEESLFVYEEDGFCELKYTIKDLRRFEVENKRLKKENEELQERIRILTEHPIFSKLKLNKIKVGEE